MVTFAAPLVGRTAELAVLDRALDELARGRPGTIAVVGEPGIGKTRLLAEFGIRADSRSCLVLAGSASELEHDLPFSVFVDALDEYLRGLDPGPFVGASGDVRSELAQVFPALAGLAPAGGVVLQHERYRAHRAVRTLLGHLAEVRPLVLLLDDLHWADAASVELLGALLRRPPVGPVLLAMAMRPRLGPERLGVALERAVREGRSTQLELGELTPAEARELLGGTVAAADVADLHAESGGNPFYLEQLARSFDRVDRAPTTQQDVQIGNGVPPAVVASLREELTSLSACGRRVLEGAAVAGDPFEPELAAAAAATAEAAAMAAVDECLLLDLIRSTEVPRRFRFRHPLVRRAVYENAAPAWRLGAHERCAEALAARGAGAAARAHHVASSAREGDVDAIAVLREAGEEALRLAPGSAAHWFGEALRLLPHAASRQERIALLLARAGALTAAGRLTDSHRVLLDALALPDGGHPDRTSVVQACAAVESALGRHEEAGDRLAKALGELPDQSSAEAVTLLVSLAMNGFWRARYDAMQDWAQRAVGAARPLGDAPLTAAALAVLALADSMAGAAARADAGLREAAALVGALSDDALASRLEAAAWLAGAELYLDRFAQADAHAARALAVGRATGQGELFLVLVQILGRVWFVRGRLAEAADLLDGGIEAARLAGNRQALVWNLFNRSVVALSAGDVATALDTAEESVELSAELGPGFHSAWAAVRFAAALLAAGDPGRAVELLLRAAGGEELTMIPGSWRAYGLELLTRCWLRLGRPDEAARAARCAQRWAAALQLPLAAAWADRASAAVELEAGAAARAVELASSSAATAAEVGAPIEAAASRIVAGRALARAGDPGRAGETLAYATTELEACGALGLRDEAERELRKLGHHHSRRTRPGSRDGDAVASLTGRELQVARLVVARKTNAAIAAELFLSKKTVESHLHNIFHKLGVSSRVELAYAVERADRLHVRSPR
jgi:DNA-binding CsgD family transcriptional regulator/tetratricopeptide (TPR) repeat protein